MLCAIYINYIGIKIIISYYCFWGTPILKYILRPLLIYSN